MTKDQLKEPILFLEWFADQYECGLPDPSLFTAAIAYAQGLLDMRGPDENKANLHQIIGVLRSAEVMVRVLKQYQVRMPHG